MANIYSYLSDHTVSEETVDFNGITLEAKAGFTSMLLLEVTITESDFLYQILIDSGKTAEEITNGSLTIALELGMHKEIWVPNFNNYRDWLKKEHPEATSEGLPDIIILSHNHWTNYIGGIEYIQENYPNIPIFLSTDMGTSLACFDVDDWDIIEGTGRSVEVNNPQTVDKGITELTKDLILICQPSREKITSVIYEDGELRQDIIRPETEYEIALAFRGGSNDRVSVFTTCAHLTFFNVIKSVKNHFSTDSCTCYGASGESLDIMGNAKELVPGLQCYFREFIMDPNLSDFDQLPFVYSMSPGDQFDLNRIPAWGDEKLIGEGRRPAITINSHGTCILANIATGTEGGLYYRVGNIKNSLIKEITWGDNTQFESAIYEQVAIAMDDQGRCITMARRERETAIGFSLGFIDESDDTKINWNTLQSDHWPSESFITDVSIAINNNNHCIAVRKGSDILEYRFGIISDNWDEIEWGEAFSIPGYTNERKADIELSDDLRATSVVWYDRYCRLDVADADFENNQFVNTKYTPVTSIDYFEKEINSVSIAAIGNQIYWSRIYTEAGDVLVQHSIINNDNSVTVKNTTTPAKGDWSSIAMQNKSIVIEAHSRDDKMYYMIYF